MVEPRGNFDQLAPHVGIPNVSTVMNQGQVLFYLCLGGTLLVEPISRFKKSPLHMLERLGLDRTNPAVHP